MGQMGNALASQVVDRQTLHHFEKHLYRLKFPGVPTLRFASLTLHDLFLTRSSRD